MSYTPINSYVFEAAYSGALAGMNASAYAQQSPAAVFTMNATVAGAWAQEFDTIWNSATLLNQLQYDAIRSLSQSNWLDRTPQAVVYTDWASTGNTSALNPATYQSTVQSIISIISAASLYFSAQGITPPGFASGNATMLQGQPLLNATLGTSNILASDNAQWKSTRREYWLHDFFNQYGGADDGVTDCHDAIEAWLLACKGGKGRVRKPAVAYAFYSKVKCFDQTDTGNCYGVFIEGDNGDNQNGTVGTMFESHIPSLSGTAASITAYTNGGSGYYGQTFDLGPGSGVLAANKANLIGEWFIPWNTDNPANGGPMGYIIVDVPADNQVIVSNQNTGAANTDANNGAICWRIATIGWDIRMRDFVMRGITIQAATGFRLDCCLQQTFAPGAGAQQVIRNLVERNSLINYKGANGPLRDAIWVARSVVPLDAGNSLWAIAPAGLNGAGMLQEKFPYQVDTMRYRDNLFGTNSGYNSRFGIAFFSRTGQSKENYCSGNAIEFTRCGIGVPRTRYNGTLWSVDGNPQFSVDEGSFAACETWIRHGSTSSGSVLVANCYGEAGGRIYEDEHGLLPQVVNFFSNVPTIAGSSTSGGYAVHPSGEIYTLNGTGPYNFIGGFDLITGVAANPGHILCRGDSSTGQTRLNFNGQTFYTNPGWTRKPRITTYQPGPWKLAGTESFTFVTSSGTQSVTLSLANFNATLGAGVVNMNEVYGWQIAQVINKYCTVVTAWADAEDTAFYIQGVAGGTLGTLQITVSPPQMKISGALTAGSATTQIGTDSSGMIEVSLGSAAVTRVNITNQGSCIIQPGTLTLLPFCDYPSKSYSATFAPPKQSINGIKSLNSLQTGVNGNNWFGSLDISDAATTGTVTFATAEPDANYTVTSLSLTDKTGAPATKSVKVVQGSKTASQFQVVLDAAPGAGTTVTVNWTIAR